VSVELDDATAEAVSSAVQEMSDPTRTEEGDFEDFLIKAGMFVAEFGSVGDVLEGQALTDFQNTDGRPGVWDLLAHWSVMREDPHDEPSAAFEEHVLGCPSCSYLEAVLTLYWIDQEENCHECDHGLIQHDIKPDMFGEPHAWCRPGWFRSDPAVYDEGDNRPGGDHQDGPAYSARWAALLKGGYFAVVTAYYYAMAVGGRSFLEERVEYIVTTDLGDVTGMQIGDTVTQLREIDNIKPGEVPVEDVTRDAPDPSDEEWEEGAPLQWRDQLVKQL
jgi:hypothetical protein